MWGVFLVLFWSRKPYLTSKTIFGTQLAPPDPSLGGSKGVLGSKLKLNEGCLLSTILVKDTLWNKSFNSEKIQPILIPSKIIPVGCVDLNSKINFAICHWS